jgi:hypothetical protein
VEARVQASEDRYLSFLLSFSMVEPKLCQKLAYNIFSAILPYSMWLSGARKQGRHQQRNECERKRERVGISRIHHHLGFQPSLCSLLLVCSAFPFPRSSSTLSFTLSHPSHPLRCSRPSSIHAQSIVHSVLHSKYRLDSTNLPKFSKRARATASTSELLLHRRPCPHPSSSALDPWANPHILLSS